MPGYITKLDLLHALPPSTVIAIYDDSGNGVPNDAAITAVIERAEAMVDSYLVGIYENPVVVVNDPLVRAAAIDFAVAYSFERHPEYVRTMGGDKRATHWMRAVEIMERVRKSVQVPPVLSRTDEPANVGGVVRSGDPDDPDPKPKWFVDGMGDF